MSETTKQEAGTTSRRAVIGGVGAIGVAFGLAACGSDGGQPTNQRPGGTNNSPGSAQTTPAGPIKTSDIPVGGGKIFPGDDTVVTQPKTGEFKAFSATCTHEGCTVSTISNGTINCPCHGSRYSIEDGSVKRAAMGLTIETQEPLPAKAVTIHSGVIEVS